MSGSKALSIFKVTSSACALLTTDDKLDTGADTFPIASFFPLMELLEESGLDMDTGRPNLLNADGDINPEESNSVFIKTELSLSLHTRKHNCQQIFTRSVRVL